MEKHKLYNSVLVEQLDCRITRIKQGKNCMSVIFIFPIFCLFMVLWSLNLAVMFFSTWIRPFFYFFLIKKKKQKILCFYLLMGHSQFFSNVTWSSPKLLTILFYGLNRVIGPSKTVPIRVVFGYNVYILSYSLLKQICTYTFFEDLAKFWQI